MVIRRTIAAMDEEQTESYYADEVWQELGADETLQLDELLTEAEVMFPDSEPSDPARFEEDGTITPPRIVCAGLHAFDVLPELHRQIPDL